MDKVSFVWFKCNFHSHKYVPWADNAIQVAIMRKEFLILETTTREGQQVLVNHFKDCIEFSGSGESETPIFDQLTTAIYSTTAIQATATSTANLQCLPSLAV